MRRLFVVVIVAGGLAACAQPIRKGPPAPIVSAPTRPPASAPATTPEPAPEPEPVAVYPYREPSAIAEPPPAETPTGATADADSDSTSGTPSDVAAVAPGIAEPPLASTSSRQLPDQAEAPELPPAAEGLRRQAEQQRQARDYAGAAASLERALRIAPQSAYLWNRLARVRLEQGLVGQAGNLAARSNALAGDEARLKQDNWAVIAVSRRSAGDIAGAAEAERLSRGG